MTSKMAIRWKKGSRVTACSAQKAYETVDGCRTNPDGSVDIDKLIHISKPKGAPLHNAFTWNKDIALAKVQQLEAKYVIRSIEVVQSGMKVPIRAFESIKVDVATDLPDEKPTVKNVFHRVEDVLADPAYRAQLLQDAIKDAITFRKRYSALQELSQLIQVMDKVIARL